MQAALAASVNLHLAWPTLDSRGGFSYENGPPRRSDMKAHDILQSLPDEAACEIFQHLSENDKPAYRACIQVLAQRRKLRPVILERKPRTERHLWMRTELARKANEDAATDLLQTWLLGSHSAMVCQFLDDLDIPHNGRGLLDTLPAEPSREKLTAAIDRLFANHSAAAVVAYLQLFVEMDIADWPGLKDILQTDSRLCLAPQTLSA